MKTNKLFLVTLLAAGLSLAGVALFAQDDADDNSVTATFQHQGRFGRGMQGRPAGLGFVDEDGDGINDRLQDSDGDGIINALDPDSPLYRQPGTRHGLGRGFVDEDGDGINDCLQDSDGDGIINALDQDSRLYRGATGGRLGRQEESARGRRAGGRGLNRSGSAR